jgi:hypothetical protein
MTLGLFLLLALSQSPSPPLPQWTEGPKPSATAQQTQPQPTSASSATPTSPVTPPATKEQTRQAEQQPEPGYLHVAFGADHLADWALFLLATAGTWAAIHTLNGLAKQNRVAEDSLKAAQDSLRVAEQALAHASAAERAYVVMSHCPPGLDLRDWNSSDLLDPAPIRVKVRISNYGMTPAQISGVFLGIFVGQALPDTPPYGEPTDDHFLLPTGKKLFITRTFFLPQNQTEQIQYADHPAPLRLWLLGYVDYKDVTGQRHRGGYARRFDSNPETIENNLSIEMRRGYNYDRERGQGEGNDWEQP